MPYVKLDCGMLDSTTWFDKDGRDIFITALLMAIPKEFDDPLPQLEVNSLEATGWEVPAGWYGFVDAASLGIISRCGIPVERGIEALERLGSPEVESRSQAYDGRRLVRIDGGFLVLNYINYREKDHTAAERQRRYRAKQKARNAVTSRNITQAEAEAKAKVKKNIGAKRAPKDFAVTMEMYAWAESECQMLADEVQQETEIFKDHEFAKPRKDWQAVWRNWMRRAAKWRNDEKAKRGDSFDAIHARTRKAAGLD